MMIMRSGRMSVAINCSTRANSAPSALHFTMSGRSSLKHVGKRDQCHAFRHRRRRGVLVEGESPASVVGVYEQALAALGGEGGVHDTSPAREMVELEVRRQALGRRRARLEAGDARSRIFVQRRGRVEPVMRADIENAEPGRRPLRPGGEVVAAMRSEHLLGDLLVDGIARDPQAQAGRRREDDRTLQERRDQLAQLQESATLRVAEPFDPPTGRKCACQPARAFAQPRRRRRTGSDLGATHCDRRRIRAGGRTCAGMHPGARAGGG